jgi:NTE family protein
MLNNLFFPPGFFKLALLSGIELLSGCATYGEIENAPSQGDKQQDYSISSYVQLNEQKQDNEVSISLAFSGGGLRAAAFSYGVLEALRQAEVKTGPAPGRLLDNVDMISSVSGGSFTSAYYGLYGDGIFNNFKNELLYQDVESQLIAGRQVFSNLADNKTRTELAVQYFDRALFHGATFADLLRKDSPLIVINASDLGDGLRLSFTQEYFNLLCSDLTSFPVSRAVTASMAVPLLFSPVVLRNYAGCVDGTPDWLAVARHVYRNDLEMSLVVEGLETYLDKNRRKYIHLVDGGITDNLGLRALYDIMQLAGGPRKFLATMERKPPGYLVVVVVDASTYIEPVMNSSKEEPSLEETVTALTDAQLHRYNAATIELVKQKLFQWAEELSTPEKPVRPYFIHLRFKDLQDETQQQFINRIPTSLSLDASQVDALIMAGHTLLGSNQEFQRLLKDLGDESVSP